MEHLLDKDIFSNDINYFFCLHSPRFEYMNIAMAKSLSKRYGKEFRPIRIISGWPSKAYNKPNYIIQNKEGYSLSKKYGKHVVAAPTTAQEMNMEFSKNSFVYDIAKRLLKKQKTVFVFPFEVAFLDLPENIFTILGPERKLAESLDSKLNQLKLFGLLGLPHIKHRVLKDETELSSKKTEIIPCYLSASHSTSGGESGLIYSHKDLNELLKKVRPVNKKRPFVVMEIFDNIELAPNINGVVDKNGNVYILVFSDQVLNGNKYMGNIYPSVVSKKHRKVIYDSVLKIGKHLSGSGYRGLFGCDFLINNKGEMVVVDINPRHQGGYTVNGLALSNKGMSLTDIELAALSGEEVKLSQEYLDEYLGFAWTHKKIFAYEKGETVQEHNYRWNIEEPFSHIGQVFETEFYEAGSLYLQSFTGYQIQTAIDRESLNL